MRVNHCSIHIFNGTLSIIIMNSFGKQQQTTSENGCNHKIIICILIVYCTLLFGSASAALRQLQWQRQSTLKLAIVFSITLNLKSLMFSTKCRYNNDDLSNHDTSKAFVQNLQRQKIIITIISELYTLINGRWPLARHRHFNEKII